MVRFWLISLTLDFSKTPAQVSRDRPKAVNNLQLAKVRHQQAEDMAPQAVLFNLLYLLT